MPVNNLKFGERMKHLRSKQNISQEALAEMLGVSPDTVTRYANAGLIKALCFGAKGKVTSRYSAESVRALLERGSGKAVA